MQSRLPDPLGWVELGLQIAHRGNLAQEDLAIPTLPGLLNLAGVQEIGGQLRITWTCCRLYEVKVQGGGPMAEVPAEPTRKVASSIGPYQAGLKVDALLSPGNPFNPLSWEPIAFQPLMTRGLCVTLDDQTLCLPKAPPWSPALGDVEILRPTRTGLGRLELGFLRTQDEGQVYSLGRGLRAWVGDAASAVITPSSATILLKGALTFVTNLFDISSSVLYPLKFIDLRLRPGDKASVNAITLRGPRAVSIVSPEPFDLEVGEGRLTLTGSGPLFLVDGGEVLAFRVLLESIIRWAGTAARPLGRVQPGPASIIVDSADVDGGEPEVKMLVLNPTSLEGQPEIHLNFAISSARVVSPLGSYDLPGDRRGLLRIPAPSGCYCEVVVKVSGPSKP
ncbi:MAG: hypothetical protein ACP5FT_00065 [Acidilobus sp.]